MHPKYLFLVAALGAAAALRPTAAAAQATPNYPADPAAARAPRPNAQQDARQQRRARMSPDEARHDEQMALLEARTGNTTFGRGGPERQLDKPSSGGGGGFVVRKFKARPGQLGGEQRGNGQYRSGIDPPGKPLAHPRKSRKRFGIF